MRCNARTNPSQRQVCCLPQHEGKGFSSGYGGVRKRHENVRCEPVVLCLQLLIMVRLLILSRPNMAKSNRKIIISCAITGSVHTPTIRSISPANPTQILESPLRLPRAGAAILHIHAREPEAGRPSGDPAHYREICPVLAERTSAIINITTGGSSDMKIENESLILCRPNPRCVR